MYPHHVFNLEPAGTSGMYPICYWQVSGRYFQPEPAMYSRCFCWFPGPLAPSGTSCRFTKANCSLDAWAEYLSNLVNKPPGSLKDRISHPGQFRKSRQKHAKRDSFEEGPSRRGSQLTRRGQRSSRSRRRSSSRRGQFHYE